MSESDIIIHYGVKGMKWGVRKDRVDGVPRRTNRTAKKDAKEYTQARMYYGEGAGTRRKLINRTVESRSKDPAYKKAFDQHVANTDMAKRADQARSKRSRTDKINSTRKTARGISHMMRGNTQYASALAAGLFTAAVYAHKTGVDRKLLAYGKQGVSTLRNSGAMKVGMDWVRRFR